MNIKLDLFKQIKTILFEAVDSFTHDIKDLIHQELLNSSERLENIIKLKSSGEINDEEFKEMIAIEENTAKVALYTMQGLGKIATQSEINKALAGAMKLVVKLV